MNPNNLGMGVMIGMLGGNKESVEALQSSTGKTITSLALQDDALVFGFSDGFGLVIEDKGQFCCESRYMRTDDKLSDFIGSQLLSAELKSAPGLSAEYGDHEIQFLDITTSKGVFQMASHNEHNGYYGGFWIVCRSTHKTSIP